MEALRMIGSLILFVLWIGGLLALYLLPAIIARKLNARNRTTIFWVNFLGGWTVFGWFGALIWACTDERLNSAAMAGAIAGDTRNTPSRES